MSALARRPHSPETRIRPLTATRLDEVLAIEQSSFSDPWSREMFRTELEIGGGTYARIAEKEGVLIGYLCAVLVEDEAHVGNLAVHPAERRQGVAQALIDDLVLAAQKRGVARVTLEVRASNENARKFYYKNDFIDVAIRKNYYRKPVEDAIVMMRIVREGPTA
ncbi:MAG TPA: ribosomal protein S18-alanine N-acetyltransferase [Candidatus Eisenbacteria bacterium]|jgi:ribosomal-protein-alanine N-acetyltransferase|nr:ribosomal protein S18-alanine N-acetyltransferase [Candidatus Eisenbacteria bacterium]